MTIKEKILQILEIKKIKKENFFTEIGVMEILREITSLALLALIYWLKY